MGIYFKVCIRFLCVTDTSKISLDILEADPYDGEKSDSENSALWKEKLKPYYEANKENITHFVKVYRHEGKSYHSLLNVLVPDWYERSVHKKSNVITFSNWADGRYDMATCYTITFYDRYGQALETVKKIPNCEVNRFMLVLPENAHSLRYTISPGEETDYYNYDCYMNCHFFNFTKKCITCDEKYKLPSSMSSISSSTITCGENDEKSDSESDDNDLIISDDEDVDDDDDDDDDNEDIADNCTSANDDNECSLYCDESHRNIDYNSDSL